MHEDLTGTPHTKRPFVSSRHRLKNNSKRIILKSIKLIRIGSSGMPYISIMAVMNLSFHKRIF